MDDRRTRTGTDDPAPEVPEADRLEREPAIDEVGEPSPEADEADQLEQAATLPGDDDDYPHDGRD